MLPNKILILSRNNVKNLLSMTELIDSIRLAYIDYATNKNVRPQRVVAYPGNSSIVINFPGWLASYKTYTVKVNVKTPTNTAIGLPFLVGTILLLDCATGLPLAIFESGLITAMRTGAAGAVGVETLASSNASRIALFGCGTQGEWQLRALHAIGRINTVKAYDILPERAINLATNLSADLDIPIEVAYSATEAVSDADILISVTQSRTPIITSDIVHPGMHINAFGSDEPGKVELSSEVLKNSLVVVDDTELALSNGALNVPYSKAQISSTIIHAEIGEVLQGLYPGRKSNAQVTIFGNIGLAFQDLVACHLIYTRAIAANIGTWVDLGVLS